MPRRTSTQSAARLPSLLLGILLALGLAQPHARAAGAVWCVAPAPVATAAPCANGEALPTIQAAVTLALPGDEIRLARGTYSGAGPAAVVQIAATALTITGGYGPGAWDAPVVDPGLTIIDGQGARRGLLVRSSSLLLANLTIQNGLTGPPNNFEQGGGLLAEENHEEVIVLDTVQILANQASGSGGGIAVYGPSELYDVTLRNNTAGEDGGGFWLPSDVVFERGLIAQNVAARSGGGGVVGGCACADLLFENNVARTGFGGALVYGTATRVSASSFLANRASDYGGAISQGLGSGPQPGAVLLSVADSLFVGNIARELPDDNAIRTNAGGALYASGSLDVQRSRFENNSSDWHGGAIFQQDISATVAISDSLLRENRSGGSGGAIALLGAPHLSRVELVANTAAEDGGALAQIDPGNGRPPAYGIFSDLLVVDNEAATGSGGGISMTEPFELRSSTVANNVAGQNGGGVALQTPFFTYRPQPAQMVGSALRDNRAVAGQGGGAYLASSAGAALTSVVVRQNSAGAGGGGVALAGGDAFDLTGVLLADNSSGQAGAGLFVSRYQFIGPLERVNLTNVTVASAQPQPVAALAFTDDTLAVTVTNTLVASHTVAISLAPGLPGGAPPTLAGDYVAFFGVATPVVGTGGPQSFSPPNLFGVDPRFNDPASGNYTLAVGSPLVDQGDPTRDYSGQLDAAGRRVPAGPRADIGAFEQPIKEPWAFLPLISRTP